MTSYGTPTRREQETSGKNSSPRIWPPAMWLFTPQPLCVVRRAPCISRRPRKKLPLSGPRGWGDGRYPFLGRRGLENFSQKFWLLEATRERLSRIQNAKEATGADLKGAADTQWHKAGSDYWTPAHSPTSHALAFSYRAENDTPVHLGPAAFS